MKKLALDDDILLNIDEGQKSGRYSVCNVFSGGTSIVKQRFAHIISCSLTESFTFMEKEIIWDYVRL